MKSFAARSILAAAVFASIAAQAQEGGRIDYAAQEVWGPATPLVTASVAQSRTEIQNELRQARVNGELDWANAEINGGVPSAWPATGHVAR